MSNATSSATATARELTQRLIDRVAARGAAPHSAAVAAQAAFESTYRELVRSLGRTGSEAILARALAQVQTEHPVLQEISIGGDAAPFSERVTAIAQAHGAPAIADGLRAWLETVLKLLGQLIGVDVVARLIEQSTPTGAPEPEEPK